LLFLQQISLSVLLLRIIVIQEIYIRAHGRAPLQDGVHPWNPPFVVLASSTLNVIPTEVEGSRTPYIHTLLTPQ
jgi:hypothetical protein